MNFIFLKEGMTASIIPILTLIEYKPESIVGCVLLGQAGNRTFPGWFVDSTSDENPAAKLLEYVEHGQVLSNLDIFLVVKEPNSLLQFNVLATVGSCNLNSSGEGGRGGRKVLELLAKYNIRTYPAEVQRPSRDDKKSLADWHEKIKEAFQDGFNVVATAWLPECWGLEQVRY